MATPQQRQTRQALAEIPDRFEAMRFATAPTPTLANQQSPDDPVPAAIFNATTLLDNATNVALAQECISPMLSPDEFIIKQRGRRRFTTWSPDNPTCTGAPTRSPFQRTPTKMPPTTAMILRSSPRKRLTMGSTPPDSTPVLLSPTKAKQQLWPGTPMMKKLRLGANERPLAQMDTETALPVLLQGLSQQQLIQLIVDQLVAGDAEKEKKLRSHLPLPDIEPMEQELLHAKRNIFKSLPTSRLCKKTDSSAYSRAAVHLTEFKRLLNTHIKQLYDSAHWDALLDYVTMAWPCVRATPQWDSMTHNAVRRQCFKVLSCYCIAAVKYGGLCLGSARLHLLECNLREWSKDYEDVLSCVNTLNKTLMQSRSSL